MEIGTFFLRIQGEKFDKLDMFSNVARNFEAVHFKFLVYISDYLFKQDNFFITVYK